MGTFIEKWLHLHTKQAGFKPTERLQALLLPVVFLTATHLGSAWAVPKAALTRPHRSCRRRRGVAEQERQ